MEVAHMKTLVKPLPRVEEELVKAVPEASAELVAEQEAIARADEGARMYPWRPYTRGQWRACVDEVASRFAKTASLSERLPIYVEVGKRFKAEARPLLNAAAARWPEKMPRVNDDWEWKALLSADLS
jgi:hypothetical protein